MSYNVLGPETLKSVHGRSLGERRKERKEKKRKNIEVHCVVG